MADPRLPGIERIACHVPAYYVELADLAQARGVKPARYTRALGQQRMAAVPPGADVVTMAADAAERVLTPADREHVELLLFATESGIDQAKAAGVFVHGLLDLPSRCRVVELKQACYSGTAGLQLAAAQLRLRPEAKALVIASDVARYGLGTAGEPTQGACAVAMLLSTNPQLAALEPESGLHTEDVMDFWRPNYLDTAVVDGKLSVRAYTRALAATWEHYHEQTGRELDDFARFCYHMPFSRMAEIAHQRLCAGLGQTPPAADDPVLADAQRHNRVVGNSYTASVYLALQSALEHADDDLTGRRLALFSYGSGAVAEFFGVRVGDGYADALDRGLSQRLQQRTCLTIDAYERVFNFGLPQDGSDFPVPQDYATGPFRLEAIRGHERIYTRT